MRITCGLHRSYSGGCTRGSLWLPYIVLFCITLMGIMIGISIKSGVNSDVKGVNSGVKKILPSLEGLSPWHLQVGKNDTKSGRENESVPDAESNFLLPSALDYETWVDADRSHLAEVVNLAREDRGQALSLLQEEIRSIRGSIIKIEETGAAYVDPRRQYRIYDPPTTGRLYALHRGLQARERLIESGFSLSLDEAWDDGHKFQPTPPEKWAQVSEVVRALNDIDLPDQAFTGYRVYLMPYSMGYTSGEGGPGYSIIASEPREVDLIPNQVYLTVTHEFGHHLHLTYIGEEYDSNPILWRKYMSLRGIPRWYSDGEVQTCTWKSSTEEAFAEDVKVLLGGEDAREDAYLAGYGDPRTDPERAKRLVEFFQGLVKTGLGNTGYGAYVLARETQLSPWLD